MTPIFDMSSYKLTQSGFVVKQSKAWIVKALVILLFALALIIPKPIANSFQQYTPISILQEQTISKVAKKILDINDSLKEDEAQRIVETTMKWSKEFQIDPALMLGVIYTESRFDKHAISGAGAFGLMQVLPRWHNDKIIHARKKLGKPELFDIETNIYLGAWILKDCLKKYQDTSASLKCYNGSVGMKTDYHTKVIDGKRKFDQFI